MINSFVIIIDLTNDEINLCSHFSLNSNVHFFIFKKPFHNLKLSKKILRLTLEEKWAKNRPKNIIFQCF